MNYPYEDCFGRRFRVEPLSNADDNHEWVIFENRPDEFGPVDEEVDTVDDCDTVQEAVAEWQKRQLAILEADA